MQVYDIIMILVIAGATLLGAWKGLAWQVASLASIFASYFIAYQFRRPLAAKIDAEPPWNTFLAMLILYLGSALAIWLAFRFVSNMIDRVRLKEFDRHAGAVMGFARGVLWCVIITLFAVTLLGKPQQEAIVTSRSGHYIALLLDKSHSVMPREVHEVLHPYLHTLDSRLSHGTSHQHDFPFTTNHAATGQPLETRLPPASIFDGPARDAANNTIPEWYDYVPAIRSPGDR